MPRLNALDKRVESLADRLKDRMGKVRSYLVEPKPYHQQKVPEDAQVRKFLEIKDLGGLPELRERLGDEQVNDYVTSMSGRAAKYLNKMAEREMNQDGTMAATVETKREPGDPVGGYYSADDDLESF